MSNHEHPKSGKGQPDDHHRDVDGEIRVSGQIKADLPPDLVKEYQAANSYESAREDKRFIVERVTLAFVILVAFLNIIQTCSSNRSAQSAADAVRVARDTLDMENRPWLSIKYSFADPGLNFPVEANGERSVSIPVKFSIKNVGKSIAKNVEIAAILIPIPASPIDPSSRLSGQIMPFAVNGMDAQQKACDAVPKGDRTPNPDIFPAEQPYEMELGVGADADDLAKNEAKFGDRSFVHLNLVGCAIYHSSYSTTLHTTWFSFVLSGPEIDIENKPAFYTFEVGTPVSASNIGYMQDVIARNDAN